MTIFTTEIASDRISSDNPIHQRLLKAYLLAKPHIKGHLLEVGCGEGRGIQELAPIAESYTAIDKIGSVIEKLQDQNPELHFIQANVPPFQELEDSRFDVVVSFQVIEHINNDRLFLEEIYRVLKPGGTVIISTPNIKKTLTRNPWHIREYTTGQLSELAKSIFDEVELKGITGNDKIWEYYNLNKKSVEKIARFDVLDLQHRLPAFLLQIPYDLLNRMNRNSLEKGDNDLVGSITSDDYLLTDDPDTALDLFAIFTKKQ